MNRFSKTMLRVGKYHSPDGVVDVTPNRLRHWADNFSRLTRAKQVVPMHFDHSDRLDELSPVTMSDFAAKTRTAANSVGRMVDFRVTPDGTAAEIQFETHDSKAAKLIETNAAQLSPVIFPEWKDGAGNKYKDLVTHLDIVNHPVDYSQSPATPVCCSVIRMGLKPYRLSSHDDELEDEDEDGDEQDTDLMDIALDGEESLTEGLENNPDEPMPDGDEPPPDDEFGGGDSSLGEDLELSDGEDELSDMAFDGVDGGEDSEGGLDEPSESDLSADSIDEVDTSGTSGNLNIGDLVMSLQKHDIRLPDDTDANNFLDRLHTALVATDDGLDEGGAEFEISQPQQGLVAMSVEQYADSQYKKDLARQLNGLLKSGRATPAEVRNQVEKLKTVRLSLKAGKPMSNAVDSFIANRSTLPKGCVWSPKERLRRMSVSEPKNKGALTQSEIDKAVDEFLSRRS